jgi:hypothetical protein
MILTPELTTQSFSIAIWDPIEATAANADAKYKVDMARLNEAPCKSLVRRTKLKMAARKTSNSWKQLNVQDEEACSLCDAIVTAMNERMSRVIVQCDWNL